MEYLGQRNKGCGDNLRLLACAYRGGMGAWVRVVGGGEMGGGDVCVDTERAATGAPEDAECLVIVAAGRLRCHVGVDVSSCLERSIVEDR